jgi:GNAT superfamily N-acetyltransferase
VGVGKAPAKTAKRLTQSAKRVPQPAKLVTRSAKPAGPTAIRASRPPVRTGWSFEPLTRDRWADFTTLFGEKGACAGCWCMWMRLPAKAYREKGPLGRRSAIHKLATSGVSPGLLAYEGDRAVGWIAVGPRESFRRLESSRVLAPVDARAVWSLPCFYIAPSHRRRGLTRALLEAACLWASAHGATCVEGYPVDSQGKQQPAAFMWHGAVAAFQGAGFHEVLRRSPTRPIVRRVVRPPRARRPLG